MQIKGSNAKESKLKESRPKYLKPVDHKTPLSPYSNKPRKTSRKNEKKKYIKKKQNQKNSTPTTEDNAMEGEKKRNNHGDKKCYFCQKKSYFARNCPKYPKN